MAKKTLLEKLSDFSHSLPVTRVEPIKQRTVIEPEILPAAESPPPALEVQSLVVNFNFSMNGNISEEVVEKSAQVIKGLAAAGMALLGTALLINPGKKLDKPKLSLEPRVKLPRLDSRSR